MLSLQENLQKWLTDEKARDQFVIRAGTDTEVLWNDARQSKTELVYKRTVSSLPLYHILWLAVRETLSLLLCLCAFYAWWLEIQARVF